jgi:hypothetical protein
MYLYIGDDRFVKKSSIECILSLGSYKNSREYLRRLPRTSRVCYVGKYRRSFIVCDDDIVYITSLSVNAINARMKEQCPERIFDAVAFRAKLRANAGKADPPPNGIK